MSLNIVTDVRKIFVKKSNLLGVTRRHTVSIFSALATIVGQRPAVFTIGVGSVAWIYYLSPAIPILFLLYLSTPDKTVCCE